jgi:hypothetical protein
MREATSRLQLSARTYLRVLKSARTIAHLAGEENIAPVTVLVDCQINLLWGKLDLWIQYFYKRMNLVFALKL